MSKFKYVLFADQSYMVTFDNPDSDPITLEIPGRDIVKILQKEYLDKDNQEG